MRRLTIVFCLAVHFVTSAFAREGDAGAQAYYWVTLDKAVDLQQAKLSATAVGAEVLGLAPEGRLVVRATAAQLDALRGIVLVADPVPATAPDRDGARERGLGARRPTREAWEALKAAITPVLYVEPNELAAARALLNGGATVDNSASQYFPPIRSQGSQGSCTAWAAGYYFNTYVQAMDGGWSVSGGDNARICSPAFIYPLENDGVDNGAYTYSVMRRLNEVGCASWAIMPYSASDWTTWPDEAQWVEALPRRTLQSFSVGNGFSHGCSATEFVAIKQLLANGNVLVTDTDVHSTWYDYYPRKTNGIDNAVLFAIDGNYLGGHAMTIVGYDDTRTYFDGSTTQTGAFLIANSWGPWWGASNTVGQRGYMWVSYSLFTNYNGYFGVAYYNSDRTNYTPRLYAVSGLNHAKRNYVRYRGGVGPTNSPFWVSYSAISNDGGSSITLTNNRRVAVDLTDGMSYATNLHDVRLYAEMRVGAGAGSAGTLASADFFYDFEKDGIVHVVSSTNPVVSVDPNSTGYASVQFQAADSNVFVTITNPMGTIVVPYTTTAWNVSGVCGTSMVGHLAWTNPAAGVGGTVLATTAWTVTDVLLDVGTNRIVVSATNSPSASLVAWDRPTNSWYGDGWHSNDGGGFGWGVWSLAAGANAGHFIADRSANTNLDIAASAWGLWANSGDTASGTRFLAQPMKPGSRFELKFENHWIESGRSVGVAWRNVLGEYLLEFLFVGGGTNYLINDQTSSRPTGVPFTDRGFALSLELTGTNTYRLVVGTLSFEGTLKSRGNMEIRQFHVWNYSAGAGQNYDFFVADLLVWDPVPAASVATSSVLIVRESPPPALVWEVRSAWGSPIPAVGVYTSAYGSVLTNSVDMFDTRGATQYECAGWTLSNHDPSSGATNVVVFVLTNDTVLTWRWATNFVLMALAGPYGSVSPTGGWYRAGTNVIVTAYPDPYYHFVNWTGQVDAAEATNNPLTLVLGGPRIVEARFAEDTTPQHATPHWWLASYGWTSDFETVEAEDPDGDGLATWQEWVALTDPTDSNDVLRAEVSAYQPDGYVIAWPGRTNRTYWIVVRTNLLAEPEAIVGPISGPQSRYTDAVYHVLSPVLYRISVER